MHVDDSPRDEIFVVMDLRKEMNKMPPTQIEILAHKEDLRQKS